MSNLFQTYKRAEVEFVDALGNYLIDQNGRSYLDFSSGIGVTNLGYHPDVVKALEKQVSKIFHSPNLYQSSLQEGVAQKLIGDYDYLAFFCNSGTEANEAAIKLARKSTQKQSIISFKKSFHGRTYGAMSATGQDKIKEGFGDGISHVLFADYNHIDSVKDLWTEDTAAVMLELVQGESGIHVAQKDFVTELADFCQRTGTLLIVDEVQTGIGRTGKLFAFEHFGIQPDIVTLAKGLGNGLPVGAMLGKTKLGQAFTYGSHGSTFGGNKLAMAASLETLSIMTQHGFLDNCLASSKMFLENLKARLADKKSVIEVRGLGYMIGIETDDNLTTLVERAREKGLILLTAGTNVIRLLPPITVTREEENQALDILEQVFS